MDAYEIITEYLKAERDKRKEVESINIDDQHKNIILAGINQKIASANVIKEDLNKLTVRVITNYTIQQRVQVDKKVANEFIDKAFEYLKLRIDF